MVIDRSEVHMSNARIESESLTSFARSLRKIPTSVLTEIIFKAGRMDLSELRIDRLSLRECVLRHFYPGWIVGVVKVCHPHICLTQLRIRQGIFRIQFYCLLEIANGGVNGLSVTNCGSNFIKVRYRLHVVFIGFSVCSVSLAEIRLLSRSQFEFKARYYLLRN